MATSGSSSLLNDCSALVVSELGSPYTLIMPQTSRRSQVIATSPHSGRKYPSSFMEQASLHLDQLRLVEDAGVDRLLTFQPLPSPLLMAEFPRSFVDLNRDPGEIDGTMFDGPVPVAQSVPSRYLRWGLGMIPSKAANQQDIYASPLPAAEMQHRLDGFYTPFHLALENLIDAARQEGDVLLIDCHSMPSRMPNIRGEIILGTDHGNAAAPWIIREAQDYFAREGLTVAVNAPFSGGYITRHYGEPSAGVSALQVEICRSLYLDEHRVALKKGWEGMASILCRFILHMDALMARQR